MPFATTNIVPSTTPKVTVKFAGLLLLKGIADNVCEIGVHRFSSIHSFQVMLIINRPDRPPIVQRLITGPLTSDLEITVNPRPATGFAAFALDPFDRTFPNSHELDYRWALNIRELADHADVDYNDGAKPIATLNAGVLYTPTLSLEHLKPELIQGLTTIPLNRVAAELAASIDITTENVTIAWNELGDPQTPVVLPRKDIDPDGTTYTILLMNDPPISSPTAHDELDLYYKVLRKPGGYGVPNNKKFRLEIPYAQKTDEIPCLPVTLNP